MARAKKDDTEDAPADTVLVRVSASHPTGFYSRGGIRFTRNEDVEIPEADLTDEIRNDPYLIRRKPGEPLRARQPLTQEAGEIADPTSAPANTADLYAEITRLQTELTVSRVDLVAAQKRIAELEGKPAAAETPQGPFYCILDDCDDSKDHDDFKGFDTINEVAGHAQQAHDMGAAHLVEEDDGKHHIEYTAKA